MKRKFLPILYLLLGIALTSDSFAQYFQKAKTPEEVGFSAERLKRLDALMQGFVDEGLAPNAVTFVARKGKIVHHKTFGYSNVEKRTPLKKDDIFRIASQTKLLTTLSMMMLYEEGKFLMTDPVSKHIPAFKNPKVLEDFDKETLTYTTRPAKREATIHDLLTHTAGIPYGHPLDKLPEFQIPYLNSLKAETLADVVPKIGARPLLNDPGEKFVYGLNADVAGYLVEILSGQSLDEFFKERILEPLEMEDTYFYLPSAKVNRLVPLYAKPKADEPMTLSDNDANRNFAIKGAQTYYAGGAGLVGPIEDYAKVCQLILNGGTLNGKRLLGTKTVELMTRNQIGDLEVWDRSDHFGYGLQIITDHSRYGDQATPGSLTWGGAYCSEYTIDPKEDLIMLVYTNIHPYAHYGDFVRKFRVAVYQSIVD